jgi:uncharacterized protein (TIGR02217 family)
MSFSESILPISIAPSATSTVNFSTTVLTLRGGGEYRNRLWAHPLRSYSARYGARDVEEIQRTLTTFVNERAGAFEAFRARDWSDYTAVNEPLGTGDGVKTIFPFVKYYGDYERRIQKPDGDTVTIRVNGAVVNGASYTVDAVDGAVIFNTAPTSGVSVTWSGQFHVPVRFDDDVFDVLMHFHRKGSIPSIGLKEVRLRDAY